MKLALIGGGGVRSVYFVKSLLKRNEKIGLTELTLMDNDKEKLEIYGNLCREAAKQMGSPIKINLTANIEETVDKASYIVTTIRVGKEHSRVLDERTALKHNVLGQETTGPGGFSMALRTIPVLLDYCRIIKERNPEAWIFNFSNPSGLVTEALRANSFDRVIGICDSPNDTKLQLAAALNIDHTKLDTQFYGLNHLSWMNKAIFNGIDILPDIIHNRELLSKVKALCVFDPGLIELLEVIPNEYLYYYYHREKALENITSSQFTRGEAIEKINSDMLEALKKTDIDKNPREALDVYYRFSSKRMNSYMNIETADTQENQTVTEETDGYAGVALDFIEALQGGEKKNLVLSVPNEGHIYGMDYNDVVEITCEVSKDGIRPFEIGSIPEAMLLLMKQVKLYEKLTISAIINRSRRDAYKALTVHPLVCSYSLAKELVDAYLEINKDYVGIWK
ncbi:MAG: hypothetical protein APF77_17960 [Clostridia bacterium BRH_c25]|nr:MAG: hypothetical protein APF77_17960 [Clostridia bacterium BRH_c25]